MTKLLVALLDVQASIQRMRKTDGFCWDVKASSVVFDPKMPLDSISPTELPYFLIGARDEDVLIERTFEQAGYAKDLLRLTILLRIDVPENSDLTRKLSLWATAVGDLERCLAGRADGKDPGVNLSRGGVAIDTRLETVKAPFRALGSNIVIIEQPLVIRMQPRPYGSPS